MPQPTWWRAALPWFSLISLIGNGVLAVRQHMQATTLRDTRTVTVMWANAARQNTLTHLMKAAPVLLIEEGLRRVDLLT